MRKIYKLYIPLLILLLVSGFIRAQMTGMSNYKLGPQLEPVKDTTCHFHYDLPSIEQLVTSCTNSDLSLGNFTSWIGCYGTFTGEGPGQFEPCKYPGFEPTRHVIMPRANQEFDPWIGSPLKTVFPGESHSARLGDTARGGNAEQLKYNVTVNSSNYLFIYRWAAVLESYGHTGNSQMPKFSLQVQDLAGNPLGGTCGFYEYFAPTCNPPGPTCIVPPEWIYYVATGNKKLYWHDWTTVALDLTPYQALGTIQIVFTTRGCYASAHRGYAYIETYCSALTIQTSLCQGAAQAILTAPPGFASYLWSTGETTPSITVLNPQDGDIYSVVLTSANGCTTPPITNTLHFTIPVANFTYGTACAGQPTSFSDASTINQNAIVNWDWDFGDLSTVVHGQNPTHTFALPGTYNVHETIYSTEGCTADITIPVIVSVSPVVDDIPSQIVCHQASTTAINFTSNLTGTVYTWTNNNTSIGLPASGTGDIPSFTATNATVNPVTATITVNSTYTASGITCPGLPKTFTITVNPVPTLNAVANQVVCNNGSTTDVHFIANVSGFVVHWTNNNTTIGLASSGVSNIASFTATNSSNAPVVATITATPEATKGGVTCYGTPVVFTITVNPTPNVNPVADQVFCNQAATTIIPFSGDVTGTVYSWTNNNTSIGLPASGTGNIASFTATNATAAPIVASFTVSSSYTNGGVTCPGNSKTFTITVNPTPTVNTVSNQAVCPLTSTATVTFSGSVAGTVFNWTNDNTSIGLGASGTGDIAAFTATNVTNAPVTATITVTPSNTNAGVTCTGTFTTFTITVNPNPTVNPVASQVVCHNGSVETTSFTGGVPGSVFTWTNNNTSIGLAASGSGDIPSFTGVNTTTAPVTATITVTPSYTLSGNTCTGTPVTFTIKVNPIPTVNSVASQVVCNAASTALVSYSGNVPGSVYNWINSDPSIGLSANGAGNIASFTATNGSNAPVTATITTTPVFTNTGVTCSGTPTSFTLTVNPTPTVNPLTNQVLCHNTQTNAVIFGGFVPGTVYNWTNSNSSIGLATSGTGDILAFTVTNITSAPVTATITVTPTFANSGTPCTGTPTSFTITVNPIPTVNAVSNEVLCHNTSATAVNFTGFVPGTVYNWTNTDVSIGLAASGTGNIASFTATNTTSTPVTATITATPQFTNAGVTCTGTPASFTITVNPTPTVNAVPNEALCHNAPTTAVTFTGFVPGTVYNWTNSNTSIGLGVSGSGDIASFTATNITPAPVTATITVTPTFTNSGTPCTGTPTSFTITVNPIPTVNAVSSEVLCHNASSTAVNFTGFVPGTVFNWVNTNTSIGLAASGTGNISSFTATNTTSAPVTATITATPQFTNAGVTCTGTPISFTITVNPTPTVNAIPNEALCHNAPTTAITFTGFVPGTVYNWVNNNATIGLAASGSGDIASFTATNITNAPVTSTITVTPAFTNAGTTCTGTYTSFTITVNPIPTVNSVANQVLCHNVSTAAVNFTGFVPGTIYTWTNTNTTIGLAAGGTGNIASFTATNTTNAPVTATITATPQFTNAGVTCTGTPTSFTITVNPIPTVNPVSNQTLCNAAPSALVSFSGNVPGTIYSWINSNTTIGLAGSGSGDIASFTASNITNAPVTSTITVTPAFTNTGNTCTGTSTSFTITVDPVPTVICSPGQTICSGNNTLATPLSSSVASGVSYTWTAFATPATLYGFSATGNTLTAIPSEAIYNPEITQGSVTYTVTAHYGTCVGGTNTHVVLVNPSPTVTPLPLTQNVCSSIQLSQQINFTANVSPTTYTWAVDAVSGLNPGYLVGGTTDNIPAQTLILSGASQGSIRYIITPSSQIGLSCPGSPNYATILVNPLPTPVISGPTLTCELGPDVTYSTPSVAGHSYQWTVTGGTITSAANINQITVAWGTYTASPGTLTVTETINATSCQITTPVYHVTLQQRPIPTLTGPLAVCDGSVNNLYTTESSMFQYSWQINGGNITSGGNSTVNVTWTNPGAGNWIEVNYVNALGCPGYPAKRIYVQINPLPVTTITPVAGPDCNLQSHIYETPLNLPCTYTWSATPGNVVAGQGSNSATINWLATGPATVYVTGTYAGTTGCTSSSTYSTTVYPSPTPTFTACFDVVTTQNAKPILLKGGLPLNGAYQGSPAISFDALTSRYWFNPGSALIFPGMHSVTYFSQNSFGCANTSLPVSITVLPSNATFACGSNFSDPRDSKIYGTVMLGSQCWMKENLRYSAPSPYVSTAFSTPQTDNCTFERYCLPTDASCTSYGALYQWNELMQYNDDVVTTRQGFCPPGWHVPSSTEWQNMIDANQGNGIAGGALKDMVTVQAFHAVLNGIGYLNNMWAFTSTDIPNTSLYWTSTLTGNKPVARGLNHINPSVSIYESSNANAFPVRCVKD